VERKQLALAVSVQRIDGLVELSQPIDKAVVRQRVFNDWRPALLFEGCQDQRLILSRLPELLDQNATDGQASGHGVPMWDLTEIAIVARQMTTVDSLVAASVSILLAGHGSHSRNRLSGFSASSEKRSECPWRCRRTTPIEARLPARQPSVVSNRRLTGPNTSLRRKGLTIRL